jgi:hypothetical protein
MSTEEKIRAAALLVSFTMQVGMAQPALTVKSLLPDEPGVYLLPPSSPRFAQAVATDFEYVRDLAALHPYSVVLVNDTEKDIIAYSLRWIARDPDGKAIRREESNCSFSSGMLSEEPALGSRSAHVLIPVGDLIIAGPGPWNPAKTKALNDQLAFLERFRDTTVTLDSVVFDDGSAVGQDPKGWIPRWKALLDAGRDLAGVVGRTADPDVRSELEEMRRPGLSLAQAKRTALGSMMYSASTYEEAYIAARAYLANNQLAFMQLGGEFSDLERLREVIKQKRFPIIHRSDNSKENLK